MPNPQEARSKYLTDEQMAQYIKIGRDGRATIDTRGIADAGWALGHETGVAETVDLMNKAANAELDAERARSTGLAEAMGRALADVALQIGLVEGGRRVLESLEFRSVVDAAKRISRDIYAIGGADLGRMNDMEALESALAALPGRGAGCQRQGGVRDESLADLS